MNILIADDSDIIRATIIKSIQTIKNIDTIYEAKDVPIAIRMLEQYKPDIALIDIKMPGGTGFDVLKAAKDNNIFSIVLTNYNFKHYKNKSIEGGADYFFDKALEFEQVFSTINDFINKKNVN